ncbi:ABC1 kinase family protein [Haloimpatiens lingqiaonensis]|uniref:ABC1 kinase family protein n=1 Tax=Haloimpatiens lingqiaonensis TaxID=1380675 RepID=UPI0010FD5BF2|nr:AarF/ABC1/UbiB kinase family protein [Haloimpatiens lingqiaonensis]
MVRKSVRRFREIIRVLTKHGFGYIIDSKINKSANAPVNLRTAFEELGPTFIKIGQILSTRPDILPANYIEELVKLQDNVIEESFYDINNVFYKEFNKNIDEVFLKFNRSPLASASIAQVHEATLKTGEEVIVKIQRPDIYEKMHLDLSILSKIFSLTKARFSDALIDPKEAVDELIDATKTELDFNFERENIKKFKILNESVKCAYAPYVVYELCGKKVLTMEKIDGFKINNIDILRSNGYDLKDIGKKLALCYFKQVFNDGFFHGDPHPGNLIIKEGKICFIDFGIMGEIQPSLKESLNDIILAVAYNDIDKMISVVFAIGIKKGYIDRNKLYEDIDYIFASYLNTSLQNIKISIMLQEIFDACKQNNIQLPKDLTLLMRGMVIIEGVVAEIAPEIKIMDVAIPFVKSYNKFTFLKDLDFDELVIGSYKFFKSIKRLPSKGIELIDSVLTGRAKVKLEVKDLESSVNELNKMVNRITFALVISSMIIGSSFVLSSNTGPKMYNMSIIGVFGFFIAAIMGFWLLISIIRSGKM